MILCLFHQIELSMNSCPALRIFGITQIHSTLRRRGAIEQEDAVDALEVQRNLIDWKRFRQRWGGLSPAGMLRTDNSCRSGASEALHPLTVSGAGDLRRLAF